MATMLHCAALLVKIAMGDEIARTPWIVTTAADILNCYVQMLELKGRYLARCQNRRLSLHVLLLGTQHQNLVNSPNNLEPPCARPNKELYKLAIANSNGRRAQCRTCMKTKEPKIPSHGHCLAVNCKTLLCCGGAGIRMKHHRDHSSDQNPSNAH